MEQTWTSGKWEEFFDSFEKTDWYALFDLMELDHHWDNFIEYMMQGAYNKWLSDFDKDDW
jgi:hypothetical protein